MYQNKTQSQVDKMLELVNQTKALNVSKRYKVINTGQVINKLESSGFKVTDFKINGVRHNSKKQGYQAHKVILEHQELSALLGQDHRLQLLVYNSYDKSAPLTLQLGVYRFACDNGLVVGSTYGCFKMKHLGDISSQLDTFIHELPQKVSELQHQIKLFKGVQIDTYIQRRFIESILNKTILKNNKSIIVDRSFYRQFETIKRSQDLGKSLYLLLNRVQEHILTGGVPCQVIRFNGNGQPTKVIKTKTRPIANILTNKSINELIWNEAASIVNDYNQYLKKAV